jgi:hypothetical protein
MYERVERPLPPTKEGLGMTNEIAVPSAGRAGQATQVEQARAMADVHAAMKIAMDYPRSPSLARDRMQDACSQMALAEKAFYRYNRGGQVTGASVHLARELARCWGNITAGVKELYRNDVALHSEMLAYAWDIETNTRQEHGFIVPHKRDTKGGVVALEDMRSVYENNANAGARRLRECIFAVLPLSFRTEAIALCYKTLEDGDGKPLAHRITAIIQRFGDFKIRLAQLEDKIGKPEGKWTAGDVATLTVVGQSLAAGEATVEDEFPTAFTRADDIAAPVASVETKPGVPVKTEQWSEMPEAGQAPQVPAGYVCDVCQAEGEHFQDVCPELEIDTSKLD